MIVTANIDVMRRTPKAGSFLFWAGQHGRTVWWVSVTGQCDGSVLRALVVGSGKRIVWGVDGVSKMVIVGALSLIKILKKVLNTSMGLSFENER